MARNIGADGTDVFRAVITTRNDDRTTTTHHEGPYNKSYARGRVTFWENLLTDEDTGKTRASGHIERAVTKWVRVDTPQDRPLPRDAAADLADVLRIVTETVTEANDCGGIDLNDLVTRLEEAGHRLPDDDPAAQCETSDLDTADR